jgi:hypothetical protein
MLYLHPHSAKNPNRRPNTLKKNNPQKVGAGISVVGGLLQAGAAALTSKIDWNEVRRVKVRNYALGLWGHFLAHFNALRACCMVCPPPPSHHPLSNPLITTAPIPPLLKKPTKGIRGAHELGQV